MGSSPTLATMKQRRKTIGATKTRYPTWDRREPVNELVEQTKDLEVKQIQTQEVTTQNFVEFLKTKGIISQDTMVSFVIGHEYYDPRDNTGTPVVKGVRLTKEIEVKDMLL